VSRLATSHFHLKIVERIGETDGIKALDRNGKALKKEKCYYYYYYYYYYLDDIGTDDQQSLLSLKSELKRK